MKKLAVMALVISLFSCTPGRNKIQFTELNTARILDTIITFDGSKMGVENPYVFYECFSCANGRLLNKEIEKMDTTASLVPLNPESHSLATNMCSTLKKYTTWASHDSSCLKRVYISDIYVNGPGDKLYLVIAVWRNSTILYELDRNSFSLLKRTVLAYND